jgi:uncharacterized glyoxalase superfamily protein PhnB
MAGNRSAPDGPVIPVLTYDDVEAATAWLVETLGFTERVIIGPGHRAQLGFGAGGLIVADTGSSRAAPRAEEVSASVMLRVEDAAAVLERARGGGATVVAEPADHPYGERQCSFRDPGGHLWTLTQTLRDVAPEEWGGTTPPRR